MGAAAWESGSKPLVEPVFLPAVGHGPQGRVSCREAPPKDDPVVQAVGLALPEFHHLWVQDVATPASRSRGFGALCIFPTMSLPTTTPGLPEGHAGLCLRADGEG